MTTKLAGPATVFLPFNQGNKARRATLRTQGGHRDRLSVGGGLGAGQLAGDCSGGYMVTLSATRQKQITDCIFPRYHQLDVTRKLQAAVLEEGPGGKYLVQHSAGSGKTNSIAWTAHFFAELHDAKNEKLFDTVIVVSDRNVIDAQLQDALFDFERTEGVVATIKGAEASKSGELAKALSGQQENRGLHDPDLPVRP